MGKITVNQEKCKGCELCASACPQKIIVYDRAVFNSKGYHPATVSNPEKCTGCAMCATMCPDCVITVER